jgi:hypothetical protein
VPIRVYSIGVCCWLLVVPLLVAIILMAIILWLLMAISGY